jgi:hypothetical protein
MKETNALVEEYMLLANYSVAVKLHRHFPAFALLRRHQTPSTKAFDKLVQAAALVGVRGWMTALLARGTRSRLRIAHLRPRRRSPSAGRRPVHVAVAGDVAGRGCAAGQRVL